MRYVVNWSALQGSEVKVADVSATQELPNKDVRATQILLNRKLVSSTERERVQNFLFGQFMDIKGTFFPAGS